MMAPRLGTSALMLSITLWGTLLGGTAYSHLVYVPAYLSALPASVVVNRPYGLDETLFWMLCYPLLIVSLIVTLALNWSVRSRRTLIGVQSRWLRMSLRVTQLYFIAEFIAFQQSPDEDINAN